ncbi:MAG: four helix bundle protein [Chloroflexi bacterium]|nr:four helix bundle protein [Chloroflexota bacterium]
MTNNSKPKTYDLETRTFEFAQRAVTFCKELPKTVVTVEITRQLVRSATSVGANYIEANEALSKKDFVMRVKICRKEAKESTYWLKLVDTSEAEVARARESLLNESSELTKIFPAIVAKSQ